MQTATSAMQAQAILKAKEQLRVLVIGGSAGSFPVVTRILEELPKHYRLPVLLCLHRLKDKREGFKEALAIKSNLPVVEPNDKDPIQPGIAYVAPANYHMLVEDMQHFALATTELVQYSRPSIDVLFESVADAFGKTALGIILSGANRDGALGLKRLKQRGGLAAVQDPQACGMPTMPQAAIELTAVDAVLSVDDLVAVLRQINN